MKFENSDTTTKGMAMSRLTKKQLTEVRAALQASRHTLLEQVRTDLEQSGQTQYAEILGRASGDSSDEALAVTLGDLSAARVDHEVRQLRAMDAALARIDSEEFGLCVDCGEAIPPARLVANPAAVRCIGCQEVHEKTYSGSEHGSL
jgi:RNA polymerase-binding protein DksA